MLAAASPIARSDGAVLLPGSAAQRALLRTLAACANGDGGPGDKGVSIPVDGPGGTEFLVHILPLDEKRREAIGGERDAAVILFVRPKASGHAEAARALSERYGLTAREHEVLEALVDVGGVPMVAEVLGVSNSTVRTHVTNIFDKTGVRRQADLIKLLMEMAAAPV
jgi:DNA-binding CsgD family transcriptional regulator